CPSPKLAGKAPSCRPTGNIGCHFEFATLRRVALAQTLPRGERGPRLATDLQPRPVPQSTPPKPKPASAGVVFQKTEYWDQLPSLSSKLNAKTPRRAFCAGAFLMGFPRGIPCSAYAGRYPIPASGTPASRSVTPPERECEKRAGRYRENGAGEEGEPLQIGCYRGCCSLYLWWAIRCHAGNPE